MTLCQLQKVNRKCNARAKTLALVAAIGIAMLSTAASACGMDTDCVIGDRTYRIVLPDSADPPKPRGAIVFIHGYRGKSARVMKNRALTSLASELGIVFVAAQAAGPEWTVPGVPSVDARPGVDELAYFDALVADIVDRFAVDPERVVAAGFSSGAMMVWNLACYRGRSYAGFVPMSGTFWEPVPKDCPTGAVNLIHYHGAKDPVVPMHGRQIKDGHQGDVYRAMDLMRGLSDFRPVAAEQTDQLECSRSMDRAGHLLEICLFPGKHALKRRHLVRAWHELAGIMMR